MSGDCGKICIIMDIYNNGLHNSNLWKFSEVHVYNWYAEASEGMQAADCGMREYTNVNHNLVPTNYKLASQHFSGVETSKFCTI